MFRLLGFDVRVQSGFVMFMALIVFLYRNEFGVWLAGAIAVLTLVHELGHAVAARRMGAHAEISLGFLAGYASYRPTRVLSRAEQAWISFAGPFVHITTSVTILVAMGVNPLEPSTASRRRGGKPRSSISSACAGTSARPPDWRPGSTPRVVDTS